MSVDGYDLRLAATVDYLDLENGRLTAENAHLAAQIDHLTQKLDEVAEYAQGGEGGMVSISSVRRWLRGGS